MTTVHVQTPTRADERRSKVGLGPGSRTLERRHRQDALGALARYFGVDGSLETHVACVDRRRHWSSYALTAPVPPLARRLRRAPV